MTTFVIPGLSKPKYTFLTKIETPSALEIMEIIGIHNITAILVANLISFRDNIGHLQAAQMLHRELRKKSKNCLHLDRCAMARLAMTSSRHDEEAPGRVRRSRRLANNASAMTTCCSICREAQKLKYFYSGCGHCYACEHCLQEQSRLMQETLGLVSASRPLTSIPLKCPVCRKMSKLTKIFISYVSGN